MTTIVSIVHATSEIRQSVKPGDRVRWAKRPGQPVVVWPADGGRPFAIRADWRGVRVSAGSRPW
jgi:hypothetical protein